MDPIRAAPDAKTHENFFGYNPDLWRFFVVTIRFVRVLHIRKYGFFAEHTSLMDQNLHFSRLFCS